MIKNITFALLFSFPLVLLAQEPLCGTVMEENPYFETIFAGQDQNVTMESFLTAHPHVLKVHFWDISNDDGSNPEALTEEQMLDVVANLNKDYNDFNIFFKFDGKSQVNDEDFRQVNIDPDNTDPEFVSPDEFMEFLELEEAYKTGTINMYSILDLEGAGAYHDKQVAWLFGIIVTRYDNYSGEHPSPILMSHEVGHFLNLYHTFYCGVGGNSCENVTRDPSDPDYDADTQGDLVIDTFATPEGMSGGNGYDPNTCLYTDTQATDETGRLYSDYEPEVTNFMSYSWACQSRFSPGQVVRMRTFIDIWDGHPTATIIDSYPVSILYEPYDGEYYLAGPTTGKPPVFQYGFDYRFVDCSQAQVYNQPSDYDDTSFWFGQVVSSYSQDYDLPISHVNHTAIIIDQVDNATPRKCYNNYNRNPKDGTVIKFLDGVPNANYTITPQDSLQINDPSLLPNLDAGLYNIQKNYNDGTTQEQMILKENN